MIPEISQIAKLHGLHILTSFVRNKMGDDNGDSFRTGYQAWPAASSQVEVSPTGQEYYIENATKNTENIRKCTLDSLFRDLCPVWKPALPGSPSLFENNTS